MVSGTRATRLYHLLLIKEINDVKNKPTNQSIGKKIFITEKPSSITLKGNFVRLESLVIERDAPRLFDI